MIINYLTRYGNFKIRYFMEMAELAADMYFEYKILGDLRATRFCLERVLYYMALAVDSK